MLPAILGKMLMLGLLKINSRISSKINLMIRVMRARPEATNRIPHPKYSQQLNKLTTRIQLSQI